MYLERRATPGQDVLITRAIEAAGQFASGRSDVRPITTGILRKHSVMIFVNTSALYAVLDRDDANHTLPATRGRRLAPIVSGG